MDGFIIIPIILVLIGSALLFYEIGKDSSTGKNLGGKIQNFLIYTIVVWMWIGLNSLAPVWIFQLIVWVSLTLGVIFA